ncbi:MAG: PKD domain-containing protein [Flavobacteriales bacterium]
MILRILSGVLGTLFSVALTAQPSLDWALQAGGTGATGSSAGCVDNQNNVYVSGTFSGTTDFDPGSAVFVLTEQGGSDMFIQKLNANGELIWAFAIGGEGDNAIRAITTNSTGQIFICGWVDEPADMDPSAGIYEIGNAGMMAFVASYDSDGNFIFANAYDSDASLTIYQIYFQSIAVDVNGSIVVAGDFGGVADFNPGVPGGELTSAGASDAVLLKLNSDGSFDWVGKVGGINNDSFRSVATDEEANIYTTGYYRNTADFDMGSGTSSQTSSGNTDAFVYKVDADRNFVYVKFFAGSDIQEGHSIALDSDGNPVLSGHFKGEADFNPGAGVATYTSSNNTSDVFLAKLSAAGTYQWAVYFPGSSYDDYATGMAVGTDDRIHVTGKFYGEADFNILGTSGQLTGIGLDVFVAEYSGVGEFQWAGRMGDLEFGTAFDLDLGTDSSLHLFGSFTDDMDFDFGTAVNELQPFGSYDAFVAKWNESGNVPSPPVADFNASDLSITPGGAVNFTDISSGQPTSWSWTFSGGVPVSSSVQNPSSIVYPNAGCYTVTLTATNADGTDSETKTCYIVVAEEGVNSCEELYFSEYLEGSGNNKALELYNPAGTAIDLSNYEIRLYANGATTPTNSLSLTGTLAWQSVFVVANAMSSATILSIADITSGVCNFNGDDALGLYKNDVLIDVIGEIGVDPGAFWIVGSGAMQDYTLVRKFAIDGPEMAWSIAQNEWDVFDLDDISQLGDHTSVCEAAIDLPTANFTAIDPTVCIGESVQCINLSSNATSYAWSFPGGTPDASNAFEPVVTYSSAGIKTITLTATSGEFADTYAWAIEVLPDPTTSVESTSPVCSGDLVVLSGSISNSDSFTWSPETGLSSPGSLSPVCYPEDDITYTLNASNGNCSASASFTIVVNELPQPVVIQIGNQLSVESFASIQWLFNGGLIPGATNEVYLPLLDGNYAVSVVDENGCVSFSEPYAIVLDDVSEIDDFNYVVYPNPIDEQGFILVDERMKHYDVLNTMGQVMDAGIINGRKELNTSGWQPGLYTLRLYGDEGMCGSIQIIRK